MMEAAIHTAAREMRYTCLRAKQEEAIIGFVSGRDVFVSLPTGSGKSLCYSVLPRAFDIWKKRSQSAIAIVVSPLVSLMEDQVHPLRKKGIRATS